MFQVPSFSSENEKPYTHTLILNKFVSAVVQMEHVISNPKKL